MRKYLIPYWKRKQNRDAKKARSMYFRKCWKWLLHHLQIGRFVSKVKANE